MDVPAFVAEIKRKPELSGLSDAFVHTIAKKHLKGIQIPASERERKLLLKEIRAELRLHTGRFHKKKRSDSTLSELVDAHVSTHERIAHYDFLKSLIAEYAPNSILDLGCGLNPILLAKKGQTYYACDIHEKEIKIINDFFKKEQIKGHAFVADVRTYTQFPKIDLCLMLKLLDIIDTKGRANAEALIKAINARTLIVSFPTRKLSGKRMNRPRRTWFEHMLARLSYPFQIKEIDNELFYLVTKP
ncbi:MAG: hypothetical protein AABX53_04510 [Nanoarchaeota archaeon]